MTGAHSRNKGKRGELELVHLLSDYLGIKVNRNYKQVAEAQHGDIEQLVGPYLIEAKNCAAITLNPWWAQTVAAAKARDAIPCLVYRLANKRQMEDRWRFCMPHERAWETGHDWRYELRYTQTVGIDVFALMVQERL
jgi:hypothetical protein